MNTSVAYLMHGCKYKLVLIMAKQGAGKRGEYLEVAGGVRPAGHHVHKGAVHVLDQLHSVMAQLVADDLAHCLGMLQVLGVRGGLHIGLNKGVANNKRTDHPRARTFIIFVYIVSTSGSCFGLKNSHTARGCSRSAVPSANAKEYACK